jgi:CRISPR/Cas system-associated exonuclease Cas4 (RecB family)
MTSGNSFLDRVAADLYAKLGDTLGQAVIIFPNKRPASYLIQALADIVASHIEAPAIFSIEEFIASHSTYRLPDTLELLFQLFEIYRKYRPEEDFDRFYGWGSMLLKDYDEIDRYLVDTDKLFSNLAAIKELESNFMPTEDQKMFWDSFGDTEATALQARFMEIWDVVRQVYTDFKVQLHEQSLAYTGMSYRQVADLALSDSKVFSAGKYIFVGFNALSRSEEVIIQSLLDKGKALIYWDADNYYISNRREEAGHFIRKSMKRLQGYNEQLFTDSLATEKKSIHIVGVPLQVGQAKTLGVELKNYYQHLTVPVSTGIVLPDENILLPVLHALPELPEKLSVSAGYPLKLTAFFSLIENVISLQDNYNYENGSYYYKDVAAILTHSLVRDGAPEEINSLLKSIEKNQLIYVSQQELDKYAKTEIIRIIFEPVRNTGTLISYFNRILQELRKSNQRTASAELVNLDEFQSVFEYLSTFLLRQKIDVSRGIFLRLLREAVSNRKIALSEDTTSPLQVLGMLETRCLNFDTIFFLSANEGVLPAGKMNSSYIPYDLRKAFGLPTADEQDALYAYYFLRLIQGAKEIFLIYNSETGSRGEEKSRYIRQIEHFLQRENPNLELHYRFYSLPLRNQPAQAITIQKDQQYFDALHDKNTRNGLSPSFISSYYVCPLKFTLQYIVQLKPQEEISEDLEAAEFGTFFHATMEEIYKELIGETVTAEILEKKRNGLTLIMERVLKTYSASRQENMLSRNSLALETIRVLIEKTLEKDIAYAPFRILSTESLLQHTLHMEDTEFPSIQLQGTIDRVDEKGGTIRIVDYKTGHVNRKYFNYTEPEEQLSADNKEAFQTLFYTWLYHKNYNTTQLQPTLLALRKVAEGYQTINAKDGPLTDSNFSAFEKKLKETIAMILDKETLITQTDDHAFCAFCNYNNICLR